MSVVSRKSRSEGGSSPRSTSSASRLTRQTQSGSRVARSGSLGIVVVLVLVIITLYMAFAFPYTLLHLKQTETTEIKAVIIVARAGDKSPNPNSYFAGEEPPEELNTIGFDQLTNDGKERLFSLGKFLKLRYFHTLLNGNPRKIYARSSDSDRCLESTQALIAALNPPKNRWLWSNTNEWANWQPKAIHTAELNSDDLLSDQPNCFRLDQATARWKNSSRYQQLLSEFRHDLQTLRTNTGLDFEDDLEMLADVEDSLATRKAYNDNIPPWYTSTFANRLAHIADVSAESRYSSANTQRLYVGRLLHEISENVNTKIRLHQLSLAAAPEDESGEVIGGAEEESERLDRDISMLKQQRKAEEQKLRQQTRLRLQNSPNFFIYMTHKNRLSALLNSLQIYTSQPHFGSILLIELHYDPINQVYFLRLFTISPSSPDIFPEPLRVNPIACADSGECSPQQFEQNIRHLMLDKLSWQEACLTGANPVTQAPITPTTSAPLRPATLMPSIDESSHQSTQHPATSDQTTTTFIPPETTTMSKLEEKLDETLIVGPTGSESATSSSTLETSSPSESSTLSPTLASLSLSTLASQAVPTSTKLDTSSSSVEIPATYDPSHLVGLPAKLERPAHRHIKTHDVYYPERKDLQESIESLN